MEGRRVATLKDEHAKLEVEVWTTNGWFFCQYRHIGQYEDTGAWKSGPKPYKHVLGAIRGAYYNGTGQI